MKGITNRQRDVLNMIMLHVVAWGYPPTIREICKYFGWSGVVAATQHIDALVLKGFLRVSPRGSRAITVLKDERGMRVRLMWLSR